MFEMKYNGKIYFDNKSLEVNEQMMTLGLEMRGGGRGVLSTLPQQAGYQRALNVTYCLTLWGSHLLWTALLVVAFVSFWAVF